MRKNNKALYESIMRKVSRVVKNALNERVDQEDLDYAEMVDDDPDMMLGYAMRKYNSPKNTENPEYDKLADQLVGKTLKVQDTDIDDEVTIVGYKYNKYRECYVFYGDYDDSITIDEYSLQDVLDGESVSGYWCSIDCDNIYLV